MAGLKRRRGSTNQIGDSPEVCGGGRPSSTPLTSDYASRPHKLPTRGEVCSSEGEEVDHSLQWRNLELSLTIESSKEDSTLKKVELVYNYLILVAAEDVDVLNQGGNVSLSRLIVRISSWIQSLLISSEDKIRSRDKLLQFEGSKLCLDCRCWEILKNSLQESEKLGIPLCLSGNLLRVISFAFRNALNFLNDMSLHPKDYLELEGFKLYRNVYDCIRSMFSLNNGALKGSMDSWMAAVGSVLDLVTNIFAKKMESTEGGVFFIDLSCSVLEPFSKFLRVQRWRKNAFRDFVDNLLQPLFHLLGLLHDQSSIKNNQNLSNLIEEIISCGLFHPSHMDEFLKLQCLGKYTSSSGEGLTEFKIEIRSYQRHLFEKLQDIVSQKNEWELSGTGELFQLFVKQVKNQKRELLTVEGFKHMEGNSTNHMSLEPLLRTGVASEYNNLNPSTRKSTFDFLVQIMEPLLLEIKLYTQSDKGIDTSLLNARSILRSLNLMLYGVICEKIYVRTEDISEGACINFFKVIYDLITSFSAKVIGLLLSPCDSNEMEQKGILTIIAEELVVAVGYILEIEHKVIEEGLIDLWLMILAFLAAGQCFNKRSEVCPLISRTIVLSCQVVNLFKELREASHAVFALCRGLRHLSFSESKAYTTNFSTIMSVTLLHNEMISKSAELLMHSLKFRMNVHEALKKIPEGQASDCFHSLIDILKSLDWSKVGFSTTMKMKSGERNSHRFSVRAELLGKVFSEIFVLVLDSIPITAGNTCSIGEALNGLITFLKPIMSGLIASDGRVLPFMQSSSKSSMSNVCRWIILFLFRLYVSCRSLSREVICLLPPRSSLKKSAVMGDAFTGYSGMDWMKSDEFGEEDYISCISQSSTSLLVLVQSIRQNFDKASSADFCLLVYTLHPMIIQRLVDLNRQMIFVQYIMQENSNVSLGKVMADDGLALFDKKEKNWNLILSDLEEEASRLTAFMLKSLSLVDQEELLIARSCEEAPDGSSPLNYYWDMCVCSLDEKTLPTAVWWIVCQNVAVWCSHANEEDTKIFLSILVRSVICNGCTSKETLNSYIDDSTGMAKVTVQQISQGLLQDTSFYELNFVRRYLASNICHALQKFTSFPDWVKFLSTLKISYIDEEKETISFLDNDMMEEFFKGRGLFPLTIFQFTVCQNLLNLLIHMPKRSLSNDTFLLCTRFVLNLERVIVRSFMETHGSLQLHVQCKLFRLLVSCRRALKCLIIAYSEERMNEESCDTGIFGESSTHVLWLLKSTSLVVDRVNNCSNKGDVHANSMVFLLLDQTSAVFMTLTKYFCNFSLKVHKSGLDCKGKASSNSTEGVNACRTINIISQLLRDQLNDIIKSESAEDSFRLNKLNKITSLLSCIQGFLWGLAASLNVIDAGNYSSSGKFCNKCENFCKISQCIDAASEFMDSTFKKFLIAEGLVKADVDEKNFEVVSSITSSCCDRSNSGHLDSGTVKVLLTLPEFNPATEGGIWKNLKGFLGRQNLDHLFFIRELFIASSAILRLRIRTNCSPLPDSLIKYLLSILQEILLEFANLDQIPKEFWFVLDGALQFMEVLGHQYASSYLTMSRIALVELVRLHFKAIGKCISMQQKIAKLASHEMESSTKSSSSQLEGFAVYGVEELKARLRMSFKMLIKNSSHLGSVIQALERALVGVQEGCNMICDITIGKDGGIVSSTVAAGIDCLDLVLECVEGRQPVKEKLQSLTASLFNIVVHLQGPSVFYSNLIPNGKDHPDPGSVVLMCIEVLTRISRKDTLFQIDVGHQSSKKQKVDVGQFLQLPAAIFQDFSHLIAQNRSPARNNWMSPATKASDDVHLVDQQFSIDLYAACCRLLCNVVKHRHSECVKKTGLLQYSIAGLLNCLEMVDTDAVNRDSYLTWNMEDGIKCACYLRRVYEAIRQQKLFKEHCFKLLSNYISVYSGFGPLRRGIKREIDEAMRPGVYALIDACSEKNLQCLHTEFGEGPCRSILASLRHDYKLHFQYHGKV